MRRGVTFGTVLMLALGARAALPAVAGGPEALVNTERAFAADAAAHGVRDAFLAHLAPTAVVFNPGPVSARKLYTAARPTPQRLAWDPAIAVLSGAGDLGWTTGPWTLRADSSKRAIAAAGTFVTLWKRQADGAYQAVFDVGVTHAPPAVAGTPMPETRQLAPLPGARGTLQQRHGLWKADDDFATVASAQGLAAALAASASPQVRWMRDGAMPVVGHDAARDSAAVHHPQGRMMSLAQFVSDSGDLGYTYGTFVEGPAAAPDSSYYLHVWERASGHPWQLALELFSPVPHAKK